MLADDVVWPLVLIASSILVVQFAARSNGSGSKKRLLGPPHLSGGYVVGWKKE